MTREDFKTRVSMAYEGREQWEAFLDRVWSIHISELPRWISVEDELPPTSDKDDESDDYLIVDSYGDRNVGHYNKMDKLWLSCDGYILCATHWMPLPALPMEIRGNQGKISPNHIIGTEEHIKVALDVLDKKGGAQ